MTAIEILVEVWTVVATVALFVVAADIISEVCDADGRDL